MVMSATPRVNGQMHRTMRRPDDIVIIRIHEASVREGAERFQVSGGSSQRNRAEFALGGIFLSLDV